MAALPVQSTVARIRTVEFFGVLLPGLYVIAASAFVWVTADSHDWATLAAKLRVALAKEPKWLAILATLLAAYLLGSIIRAFPVDRVDRRIGAFVRRVRGLNPNDPNPSARESMLYRVYGADFPYWPLLKHHHDTLLGLGYLKASNAVTANLPDAKGNYGYDLHVAFDFWKTSLCATDPNAIARVQELEARTRMFCGMFWAGAIACLVSVIVAKWSGMWWVSPCVSLSLALIFAWRLRQIRCEEARQIFFSFLINESRRGA